MSSQGERISELEGQIAELRDWVMVLGHKQAPPPSIEWVNGITQEIIANSDSGSVLLIGENPDRDWEETSDPQHLVTAWNWLEGADIPDETEVYLFQRPWGWEIIKAAPKIFNAQTYESIADQAVGDVQLYDVTPGADPENDPPSYALTGDIVGAMNWWNKAAVDTGVDVYVLERPWGREIIFPPGEGPKKVKYAKLIGALSAGGSTTATVYGDGSPTAEVLTVYDDVFIPSGEQIAADEYVYIFCDDDGASDRWIVIYIAVWTTDVYYYENSYWDSYVEWNKASLNWYFYSGSSVYVQGDLYIEANCQYGVGPAITWDDPTSTWCWLSGTTVIFKSGSILQLDDGVVISEPTVEGLTADPGSVQAGATPLVTGFNQISTVATAGDSALLPPATEGHTSTVVNDGANSADIFPQVGEFINSYAVDKPWSIPPGATVHFNSQNGTTWSVGEVVPVAPAPNAEKGLIKIVGADNAGNFEICVTNASHGQPTVITVPDCQQSTTSVVLNDGPSTQSGDITFSGELTLIQPIIESLAPSITANAGGGQAGATLLTEKYNNVSTVATSFDSVKLLPAVAGTLQTLRNGGANNLHCYTSSGDNFEGYTTDKPVTIAPGAEITFTPISSVEFTYQQVINLTASLEEKGYFCIKPTDNSGDFEVCVTNASHGQSSTYSIPDTGNATSDFIMDKGEQSIAGEKTFTVVPVVPSGGIDFGGTATLTAAKATWLADATAGTSGSNQVVVLDGSGKINLIDFTAWKIGGVSVTATAAEIDAAASTRFKSAYLTVNAANCTGSAIDTGIVLPAHLYIASAFLAITTAEDAGTLSFGLDDTDGDGSTTNLASGVDATTIAMQNINSLDAHFSELDEVGAVVSPRNLWITSSELMTTIVGYVVILYADLASE